MKRLVLILLCALQGVYSCSPIGHFQKIQNKQSEALKRHNDYLTKLRKETDPKVQAYLREMITEKKKEFTALLNVFSSITTDPEKLKRIAVLEKTVQIFLNEVQKVCDGSAFDNTYDLVKYMKYDVHAYHIYLARGQITRLMFSCLNISTCNRDIMSKLSDVASQVIEKISDCAIDGFKKIPNLPYRIQEIHKILENARNTVSFSLFYKCIGDKSTDCIDNIGNDLIVTLSIIFEKRSNLFFPHVKLATQKEETLKCMENESKLYYETLRKTVMNCKNEL